VAGHALLPSAGFATEKAALDSAKDLMQRGYGVEIRGPDGQVLDRDQIMNLLKVEHLSP
jgi:hypothetical protein